MFREVLHASILCIILKVGDDLDHCISTASNEFLADPTKARFEERVPCPSVVSAADVVNEALRLFPPTICVYRKVHLAGKRNQEIVAANIEACHRIPAIWDRDFWIFRPPR